MPGNSLSVGAPLVGALPAGRFSSEQGTHKGCPYDARRRQSERLYAKVAMRVIHRPLPVDVEKCAKRVENYRKMWISGG